MAFNPGDFPIDPYVIDGVELAAILNRIFPSSVAIQDSPTGALKLPEGTTAQRPGSPSGAVIRYNSTTQQYEGFRQGQWASLGGDSIPLFSVSWWPNRAAVPAGFIVADGQTLSRATYSSAWAGIAANNVPLAADDATWLANPVERGKYTVGDGSTTFRVPDYNGRSSGALGAAVLRGDGVNSAGTNGLIQRDALQNHEHTPTVGTYSLVYPGRGNGSPSAGTNLTNTSDSGLVNPSSARVATETRALNVTGCWVIKLFGAVINVGSADAAQLASDLANLRAASYTKANAIGFVGLAGGLPTGALFERGSNANGEYAKFTDGTMICTFSRTRTQAVATAFGAIFYNGTQIPAGNYPSTFVDIPWTGIMIDGPGCWSAQVAAATAVNWGFYYILSVVSRVATSIKERFVAIGRWQ